MRGTGAQGRPGLFANCPNWTLVPLEEDEMTRFQRILMLSAVCGVIAIGIAYLILAVIR